MDTYKKIILYIIICIIIIIIISLLILLRIHQTTVKENQQVTYVEDVELVDKLKIVDARNSYYAVNNCVNKFYSYYMTLYNVTEFYDDIEDQNEIEEIETKCAGAIFDMLDEEYINAKGIKKNNIKTYLHEIKKSLVNITEMYVSEKSSNISVYVVKGFLAEESTGNINQFQVIVNLDIANKTFNVIPQEYVEEKYNNLSVGDTIIINVNDNIEENKNNKFEYTFISNDVYAKDLFNKLKNEIKYLTKLVYNKLDNEYKTKKFSDYIEFQNYIKDNNSRFSNMQLESYQRTTNEGYIQYVLLDQNGNYYIFHETTPMEYTLMLDTYTIDIPEFTQKYEAANDQEKMILNLNKFKSALNDKDYKYAYNTLAESFRTKKFPTIESFKTYIKSHFFDANSFRYLEFGKEAETYYTYKVNINDETSTKQISKTFIMQLGEETEFKLSFDI